MATNNMSINSPYLPPNPPSAVEGCMTRLEEIPFLKVVNISTLVCPLLKKFFSDPIRLPCGHVFERAGIYEWYSNNNNAVKICPITLCQKPYDSLKGQENEDPLRKELAESFNKAMHQPNERLRNKIHELYNMLADSQEKQQIKEAIDFFCSGELSQGINRMTQISMISANGRLYLPILHLMKMQMQNVSNQINHLIQQAGIPSVGYPQMQNFPAPMAGAGMPQSLSAPVWNGMGLQQPIAFSPPLSLEGTSVALETSLFNPMTEKIQENAGDVTSEVIPLSSDEKRFINAIKNSRSWVYKLMDHIENVDIVMDENGNTPLLRVVQNYLKPERLAEALLNQRANPNIQNGHGQTALHLAVISNRKERSQTSTIKLIETLIKFGALVNSRNQQGQTPLDLAVKKGDLKIIHLLRQPLKRPSENSLDQPQAKRSRSELSIREGAENQSAKTQRDEEEKSIEGEDYDTLITKEIQGSHGDMTSQAIPISTDDLLFIDKIKNETSCYAAIHKQMEYIKNVDIVMDENGNTPLLWVVKNYKRPEKIVNILLKMGANPNIQNNHGETALHLASKSKIARKQSIVGVIEKLVELGACVDSRDKQGQTPLHLAAKTDKYGMVRILLKIGAKDDIKDNQNQLPIDVAMGHAKSVFRDAKKKKKTGVIPTSNTDGSLTFENREGDYSEARQARSEEATNNSQIKNNEDSQEDDFEKFWVPIGTEEEEEDGWFSINS